MDKIEKPRRLYLKISEKLEQAIRAGEYPRGQRLPPEQQLAKMFRVSRPTVRDAILALEVQGLVEARIGSGTYVTQDFIPENSENTTASTVAPFELQRARYLIEPEIAALTARHIRRSDLIELKQIISRQKQLLGEHAEPRPARESFVLDRKFHLKIALCSQNLALHSVVELFWNYRSNNPLWQRQEGLFGETVSDLLMAARDHENIWLALQSRSPVKARLAMRDHLRNSLRVMIQSGSTSEAPSE